MQVARIYRFGQARPTFVYRLVAHGWAEEHVYNLAIEKEALALRIVDKAPLAAGQREPGFLSKLSETPPPPPRRDDAACLASARRVAPADALLLSAVIGCDDLGHVVCCRCHTDRLALDAGEALCESERNDAAREFMCLETAGGEGGSGGNGGARGGGAGDGGAGGGAPSHAPQRLRRLQKSAAARAAAAARKAREEADAAFLRAAEADAEGEGGEGGGGGDGDAEREGGTAGTAMQHHHHENDNGALPPATGVGGKRRLEEAEVRERGTQPQEAPPLPPPPPPPPPAKVPKHEPPRGAGRAPQRHEAVCIDLTGDDE